MLDVCCGNSIFGFTVEEDFSVMSININGQNMRTKISVLERRLYSLIALDGYFSYSSQNLFVQTFMR